MNSELRTGTRSWVLASVILTIGLMAFSVLAAFLLDAFIVRPSGGGSVTTLIPGSVYATATVVKVSLVLGVASAVMAVVSRSTPARARASASAQGLPIWGLASLVLMASAPLIGALAVLVAQARATQPVSISEMSNISRIAVFVQLAAISTGTAVALMSLVRRERPRLLPWLGLAAGTVLVGLCWHFEFYAPGFDQDTWAPRS